MNGIEVRQTEGVEFRIEQQRLTDRIPGLHIGANLLLWWVEAKDADYFGDDNFHCISGGTRTKKDALAAIDHHLLDKAILRKHRERMAVAHDDNLEARCTIVAHEEDGEPIFASERAGSNG